MEFQLEYEQIESLDKSDMYYLLKRYPFQIEEAVEIGKSAKRFKRPAMTANFLILGMGGSAIGGDLIQAYLRKLKGAEHSNIVVNRDYTIPKFVDSSWNVIASSYSGNTEETLSALEQARIVTDNILCIASGGTLAAKAQEYDYPLITIPEGFMPRLAIAYSFFPMLLAILRSGAYEESLMADFEDNIRLVLHDIKNKAQIYCVSDLPDNPAIQIAGMLRGKTPIIYSSSDTLSPVAKRWKCQIQENAKNLAFCGELPEMNHNEINSWQHPSDSIGKFGVILLEDALDHSQTTRRFAAVKEIFTSLGIANRTVKSSRDNFLTRIIQLVYLGDWVSFYMAIVNNVDPTPIPLISKMKEILSHDS